MPLISVAIKAPLRRVNPETHGTLAGRNVFGAGSP